MHRSFLCLLIWISAAGWSVARPWTNAQGKVIQAEMAGSDDTTVSLKLPNGNVVPVPLASLSEADQQYVRAQPRMEPLVPIEKRMWPATVEVSNAELEKVALVSDGKVGYTYRSTSFEFTSQVRLLPSLIKEVARTFEATKRLVEALPWGIKCVPPDDMPRYLAALYTTREDYTAAGGPRNSGGVYMTKDKTFCIPFESLGIRKLGESYTRNDNFSNDTLVHEITHQMMHDYLPYLPKWAVEGSAEFTEMMPYKAGTFRIVAHEKGLKEYISRPGRSPTLLLPKIRELMFMTHSEWDRQSGGGVGISMGPHPRQRELYEQSALLVYYFNFLDGEPPQTGWRWMRFMDATRDEYHKWDVYEAAFAEYRKKLDEFLKLPGVETLGGGQFRYPSNLTPPAPPQSPEGDAAGYTESTSLKHLDLLIDGRSDAALEEDMLNKFAKIGLKFPGAGKEGSH